MNVESSSEVFETIFSEFLDEITNLDVLSVDNVSNNAKAIILNNTKDDSVWHEMPPTSTIHDTFRDLEVFSNCRRQKEQF